MIPLKWLVALALVLVTVQPSIADDSGKLVGTWRLVSGEVEFQQTGARQPFHGEKATGYIIFTLEGRMMMLETMEGRQSPTTDEDRAKLLMSMAAYTGLYRVEGDKFITKIDTSWSPETVGYERVRFFRFVGDRLEIISEWMEKPYYRERGKIRTITAWERSK